MYVKEIEENFSLPKGYENIENETIEVLSIEEIKTLFSNKEKCSSEFLCNLIVASTLFNINKSQQIFAMKELVARRVDGENFDYENIINSKLEELKLMKYKKIDTSKFSMVIDSFIVGNK